MSACNYLKAEILKALTNRSTLPVWPMWKISMHTGDPGANGTANEVPSSFAYVRRVVTPDDTQWTNPGNLGVIENAQTIAWPSASGGDWGVLTHFAIHAYQDTNTYRGALVKQQLSSSISIGNGQTLWFKPGKLRVFIG